MSAGAGPEMVTDGLVLCLDAANIKSFSGSSWFDISGNNISAALQNPATGTTVIQNGAAVFSPETLTSTAGYYLVNDSRVSSLSSTLTFETVLYPVSFACGRPVSARVTETGQPFGFVLSNQGIASEISTNTGWNTTGAATTAVGLNKWVYITQTLQASSGKILTYVNGVLVVDCTFTGIPSNGTGILVGRGYYGGAQNYTGRVALVRMYDRVLSADQISQNFQALRGRFGI